MAQCQKCYTPHAQCDCECPDTPTPVLPRCQDVVLADGTYTNATVVIEDGCITEVTEGAPFVYTPDPCCDQAGGGGGGGGAGPQGPTGAPGQNATISIGTVTTVAPGQPAAVTNTGTDTAAVLNFSIPAGSPGTAGTSPTGLTYDDNIITVTNGAVQALGVSWPPVMLAQDGGSTTGVLVIATKDVSGMLSIKVDISAYDSALRSYYDNLISGLQTQVNTLAGNVTTLTNRLNTCCPP